MMLFLFFKTVFERSFFARCGRVRSFGLEGFALCLKNRKDLLFHGGKVLFGGETVLVFKRFAKSRGSGVVEAGAYRSARLPFHQKFERKFQSFIVVVVDRRRFVMF